MEKCVSKKILKGFRQFFTLINGRIVYNTNLIKAGWQSGYAAACKAVYAGSIPASASITFYMYYK